MADRINQRMSELGLTQETLAKRARISQTAISKLASGKAKQSRKLVHIAAALNVNPTWLETGVGDRHAVNIQPVVLQRKAYPLVSWVQAGQWREIVDAYPYGSSDTFVYANGEHGDHAFGLTIVGDSMEPVFREGDIIIVDPDIEPRPGYFVVAKNHHAEAAFKKYRPRGIGPDGRERFELIPLNDDYAPLRSEEETIVIIGVQVEHIRIRRK